MNKLEAKNKAYLYATGKSPAPVTGSKADKLEGLCQSFYTAWQTEPDMEWDSITDDVPAGTVSAVDTFDLEEDIHFLSKRKDARVRVVNGTNTTYYIIVNKTKLYRYRDRNAVAYIGDGQIQFSKPFVAGTQEIGGTIYAPAVTKLDPLGSDNDEILIPEPEWLPWRMAAQYALTDRQLNFLYDDLLAQANEFMGNMKKNNTDVVDTSSSTGVDYFGSMGNVGTQVVGDGGSRTDTIF